MERLAPQLAVLNPSPETFSARFYRPLYKEGEGKIKFAYLVVYVIQVIRSWQ
jgi:hypothetical protein